MNLKFTLSAVSCYELFFNKVLNSSLWRHVCQCRSLWHMYLNLFVWFRTLKYLDTWDIGFHLPSCPAPAYEKWEYPAILICEKPTASLWAAMMGQELGSTYVISLKSPSNVLRQSRLMTWGPKEVKMLGQDRIANNQGPGSPTKFSPITRIFFPLDYASIHPSLEVWIQMAAELPFGFIFIWNGHVKPTTVS